MFVIRVISDDGTTRLYAASETEMDRPALFDSRAAAEERVRGLAWWWSRPHPDGKGGAKPFRSFTVEEASE
jgi:hypothetical protein